jgi:hypothetical protein
MIVVYVLVQVNGLKGEVVAIQLPWENLGGKLFPSTSLQQLLNN